MKILNIISVIALSGLLFTGCEKEEISNQSIVDNNIEKIKTNQSKSGDTIGYANPNNPYDAIGVIHNQKLNEYITQKEQIVTGVEDTNNFFYNKAMEELDDIINTPNLTDDEEGFINNLKNNLVDIADNQTPLDISLTSITESNRAHFFISELSDIMNPQNSNNRNIEDHISLLLSLEDSIMADNIENQNLTEEERAILLMSTSMARNSSAYWYEVEFNLTPWGDLTGDVGLAELSWGDVGVADLRSAADGIIAGMVVGSGVIAATGGLAAGPAMAGVAGASAWGSAKNAGSQLGWW